MPLMRHPLSLMPCYLAMTLAASPAQARAEEVSSVYASVNLAKCADITPAAAKDDGTVWRCKGYEGIDVFRVDSITKHYGADGKEAKV